MSILKSRKLGVLLSYANTILSMVFGILLSSFLIKRIGDTEYGIYQTITAFANYLLMLELGTGTITQRNVVLCVRGENGNRLKRIISTMWLITILISFIILIISVVFFNLIGTIYRSTMTLEQIIYSKKIFSFFTGNLLLTYITQTLNGYLLGIEQYTFSQITQISKVIVRSIVIVGIVLFYRYSIVIAFVDFVIAFVVFVVTLAFCRFKCGMQISIRSFDKGIIVESLPLCLALILQSAIQQANNSVDKVIIGARLSVESVSVYSVAQYIYSIFISVMIAPVSLYLPQIAKNLEKKLNKRDFTETLVQPTRLISIISGFILFGFISVGRPFIRLFYGTDKTQAWIYALLLIVPVFFSMTNGVIINVLDITKKRLIRSLVLLGVAISNIILTWVWVNRYGIIGAVLATGITMMLGQAVILNVYYDHSLGVDIIRLYYSAYHKNILMFGLSSIVPLIICMLLDSDLLSLLLGGCIYMLICCCLIYSFSLNESEKGFVNNCFSRIKRVNR